MMLLVLVFVGLCLWALAHRVYWDVRWWHATNGRLPRGSMGFPLVGETFELLKPHPHFLGGNFIENRISRYGHLFKSHLFGHPVIISTSSSINQFILQKEGSLFASSYPTSFRQVMGNNTITYMYDDLHIRVRKMILQFVNTLAKNIDDIEDGILKKLNTCEGKVVKLAEEGAEMAFNLVTKHLINLTTSQEEGFTLFQSYSDFMDGSVTLPYNIPGSKYNGSLKGRAKAASIIQSVISRAKMSSSPKTYPCFLDLLLEEEKNSNNAFTRKMTIDVMLSVIHAGFSTTALAIAFLIKFITQHHDVQEKLRVEHMSIQQGKEENEHLTLNDFRSMSYTKSVINETLRLANIAPLVFREAIKDVEIDGFIIPKGWMVVVFFSHNHLNPRHFNNPEEFNPSRWIEDDTSKDAYFTPFGRSQRLCPGLPLVFTEVSIFLHHLITKYRWKEVGDLQAIHSRLHFIRGYEIFLERTQ